MVSVSADIFKSYLQRITCFSYILTGQGWNMPKLDIKNRGKCSDIVRKQKEINLDLKKKKLFVKTIKGYTQENQQPSDLGCNVLIVQLHGIAASIG